MGGRRFRLPTLATPPPICGSLAQQAPRLPTPPSMWGGRFRLPTSWRPSHALAGITLGTAVFLIWIGPDRLFGYRHFWLFENSLFGSTAGSAPPELRASLEFRIVRAMGSTVLVPIVEELFWRGWLMRWLIDSRFRKVPLGTYAPAAFWLVALLFASEHGPYWEVGLAAGVLYNWWMVRTHNLADCILAHSVTNGLLSAYVLMADRWQYWL